MNQTNQIPNNRKRMQNCWSFLEKVLKLKHFKIEFQLQPELSEHSQNQNGKLKLKTKVH